MTDSIFVPKYSISPQAQTTIDLVDTQRWLISNMLLMPKHEAWFHRDVRADRAAGTTSIEGVGLEKSDVARLMQRGTSSSRTDEAERANLNAIAAYEFVDYLSDQHDIPLDELVIRQLNREFLKGELETLTPGVYRKGQNNIGNFTPPNQGDVPDLMRQFTNWLRSENEETHPIAKAAIAHIHLVAIHPFWDGNGRTARALATLVLQRSVFHFKKLLSLESHFARTRDDYLSEFERVLGTDFRPDYDASKYVESFVTNLLAAAMTLTSQLTDWHKMMETVHRKFEEQDLSYRQTDGLMYAMRVGRITRGDYMEITGASGQTATRDLAALAKLGVLRAEGKTRNRSYVFELPTPDERDTPPQQATMPLNGDS